MFSNPDELFNEDFNWQEHMLSIERLIQCYKITFGKELIIDSNLLERAKKIYSKHHPERV